MKKGLLLVLIMGLCVACSQQEEVVEEETIELPASPDGSMFKGEEWYDLVETVGVNRELYHSHLLPYGSVEEALSNEQSAFTKSIDNASFVVNLTGEWDFYYADNPFERLGSTWGVDWDSSDWDKMHVPGDITLVKKEDGSFKYENPRYINMEYPWTEDENSIIQPYPVAPLNHNAVAHYQRTFTLDESMEGKEIFLRMEGANSAYYIFVNGNRVGYSEDSYTAHEFNLTPYLIKDDAGNISNQENKLQIMLYQYSLGSYLENQDMISTFGIFRDVYLIGKEEVEIRDVKITTDNSGALSACVNLRSLQLEESKDYQLQANVYKTNTNELVAQTQKETITLTKALEDEAKIVDEGINVELTTTVANPELWYFDHPNLYTVVIELSDSEGNVKDIAAQRVGFREIDVTDEHYFTINGQYVLIKGVNRHEFALEVGSSLNKETIINDLLAMKANNINALRMSHYPNSPITYDLADELGLMVCDEANIETHYGALVGDLPSGYESWNNSVMDRTISMYERDKNHPCIIFWSLGNEATYSHNGTDLDEQYPLDSSYCFSLSTKWLLEKDPTRLRLYERDNRYSGDRESSMVDVYSSQYYSLAEVEHQLVSGKDMPYIHSEYDHSMGNALGNLNEYWQQIRSELKAQGGFIWDFKDQAVLMGTEEFSDNLSEASYLSYGGDWGDRISDGTYCGNGIFFADGSASPKVSEVKHVYQDVQVYQVDEGYQFVNEFESRNLSEFDISYEVKADGEVISSEALSLSTKPHSAEVVQVNLPDDLDPYKTYTLDFYVKLKEDTVYAEKGYEIARSQFVLQKGSEAPYAQLNQHSKFTVDEGDQEISISNEKGKLVLDKATGMITTYEFLGEDVFEENPHVNYLRATIENDFVEGKSIYEESLRDAYKGVVISQGITSIDVQDSQVNVYLEGYLSDQKSFVSFLYSYYMDGTLGIESSFVASVQMPGEFPVVGFEMKLPKDYQKVTYFGKGPDENYSDRNTGSYFDTYETTVSAMCMSKYLRPQENGYRSEVMNFSISNDTKKVEIYSNQMGFSVSPYNVNQLEEAQHWYELDESDGTYVYVDVVQRGLGNAICGPDPLEEYLLVKGKEYHQSMHIIPRNE